MTIDAFQPQEVRWCDTCRTHEAGHCDGCGDQFRAREHRYRSQSHHFHPAGVGGQPGLYAIHKTLCVDCYRVDHARVYPGVTVPDLPDRIAA